MILTALLGCTDGDTAPGTVNIAQLEVALHAPIADPGDDPLAGADTLAVVVRTADGDVIASASGPMGYGLTVPELDVFGVVEVEVTARSGDRVLAAGRSGPVVVVPNEGAVVDVLFLPVNRAIELDFAPLAARADHATFAAADGRVLLLGGRPVPTTTAGALASTEWFDPADGFGDGPFTLDRGVLEVATAPFGDHGVLVAGGLDAATGGEAVADTLILDAFGVEAGLSPPMSDARADFCLAAFLPNAALAAGGRGADDRAVEILRPAADTGTPTWSQFISFNEVFDASDFGTCAGTGTGFVAVVSRSTAGWAVFDLAAANISNIEDRFYPIGAVPGRRDGAMMIPLGGDEILVLGGADGTRTYADASRIDASQRTATGEPAITLDEARAFAQWRWWEHGRTVAVGLGRDGAADVLSMELVDLDDGTVLTVPLPALRGAQMEVLSGGVVLFTGGASGGAYAIVPWL